MLSLEIVIRILGGMTVPEFSMGRMRQNISKITLKDTKLL